MKYREQDDIASMIGHRVGSYVIDEEVGRGGMGVVYRASRADGEFDQTVAIKLIKRGMDTDAILRRFRRERQITAALNHPNIAYFYGGGSTDDGLPYFVMEFITGLPLYKHCDSRQLTIRERLLIFRQVCWAVHSAHESKVIHRDLKPSNIMVTTDGKPKLLDFGIAKVLDPDLTSTDHEPTATQLRVMTPEYASPEQISGEEVGPASDIYSLGVILYELLTGHRPYALRRHVPDEVARIIREEAPTNPSGSLTRDDDLVPMNGNGVSTERVLRARSVTLEELRRELSGDLDRVILKALRKAPGERYRSAAEFADDITNFLEGRPVKAELFPSMANAFRARNVDRLSLAILPFRVVEASPGDTGEEFLGIGLADALISRLSVIQRLIVRPTTSVIPFSNADPIDAGARLEVDHVLDGTVRILGERIRVSVQFLDVAGNSTLWAHSFDERVGDIIDLEDSVAARVAESLLPRLTEEEQSRLGRRSTKTTEAYEAYLRGRYFWSRFTDQDLLRAVESFKRAIELDPEYTLPYVGLAEIHMWSAIFGEVPSKVAFPLARTALEKALAIDPDMGEAYAGLAFAVFLGEWNWSDAETLVRRALELNPHHPFAHECYSNLLCTQGRFDEAVTAIKRAQELDPVSPRAILMTAWTLYMCRRFEEAAEHARKGNAMRPDFPQGLLHLGNALTAIGETDEAVRVLRRSAELWGAAGLPRYLLAFARAKQGNKQAVSKILSKLIETEKHHHIKPYFIAMCFVAAGDRDSAFKWFERAIEEQNEWMVWFGVEPNLDPLRDDPRYNEIVARTGNPMSQRARSGQTAEPATGGRERSIAVLPFRFIGADRRDTEDSFLGLGLADAVTMRLSNVRKFVVRPTSSAMVFASGEFDSLEAGRSLNAEYVIDGILRRVAGKLRVSVQLLSTTEGSVRWSASFLEDPRDMLELEDSISEQVTRAIIPHLTGEDLLQLERRGTNNAAAYDAYLQGRYFWSQFEPNSFPRSIEAFSRAVALDPNFALAHVGISDFYAWASIYGLIPPSEALPKMFESAARALELDPTLAEAYAAIGLAYSNDQAWATAEECYRRAVELNPNYPLGHEWLSSVFVATGRFEEGIGELLIAEGLDPLALRPKVLSAWTLYQTRDYAAALRKAEELLSLDPEFMQSHLQLANVLLELGEFDRALFHARRAVELTPHSSLPLYVLCFALAGSGFADEAGQIIADWRSRQGETYVPPFFLGMSSVAVGDIENALEYLDATRIEKSAWTIWFCTEPKLDALRDDPRFREIVRKMNGPILP